MVVVVVVVKRMQIMFIKNAAKQNRKKNKFDCVCMYNEFEKKICYLTTYLKIKFLTCFIESAWAWFFELV